MNEKIWQKMRGEGFSGSHILKFKSFFHICQYFSQDFKFPHPTVLKHNTCIGLGREGTCQTLT